MDAQREQLRRRWESADEMIRGWWDHDLRRATEAELRDPVHNVVWYTDEEHRKLEPKQALEEAGTLLFLPYPYISSGGSEAAFPEMYCWDIYFINLALLQHGRADLVRNHILNHLFMVERFGMVLNGNRSYYLTRSQTPLLAESIRRYNRSQQDNDLLTMAFPLLKREYLKYWNAPHHATPVGLATNRDLGDPFLRPELAAEAESLDFTAVFEGDVRKCAPLQLNSALVQYARALESIALELGWHDEAGMWGLMAEARTARMRELNWDPEAGFFFEYQYLRGARLPYWSLNAYWTLWARVATKAQAAELVRHLRRFEYAHGLVHTDVAYPSPHPEFSWVQWGYPCGWPPLQMVVVEGLDNYGFHDEAERIAAGYLTLMLDQFEATGKFWEKYNVVEGNVNLPRERTPVVPLHGWSTAAVVWLGRRVFHPELGSPEEAE